MSDPTPPPAPPPAPPAPPPASPAPLWAMIVGAVVLVLTLLFFMLLLIASLFGLTIPEGSRFLVTIIVAFAGAVGAGFLGGGAAISGKIDNPLAAEHPIAFGAGGGVAVLLILLLLGRYFIPTGPAIPEIHIPETPELFPYDNQQVGIALKFEASQHDLDPAYQLRIQVSTDERFSPAHLLLDKVGRIAAGQYKGPLGPVAAGTRLWVRVAVVEGNRVVKSSAAKEVTAP